MPSVMQRIGTPNGRHNMDNQYRKHLENVDPELSQYNEIVRQKSVEELYDEYLQPAFEQFNDKQKRKDRRLDVKYNCTTFLEYQRTLDRMARASKNIIDQKGRPPIREIILQYGNPEQGFGCRYQTQESREFAKTLLLETFTIIEEKFPQLKFGNVVFHADEVSEDSTGKTCGSFHLHADFVPICYNNKQGPAQQVAFERCLEEMGFKTFQEWKHALDNIMEDVLAHHGLERTFMENDNPHQASTEFHRQQRLLAQSKAYRKEAQDAKKEAEMAKAQAKTEQSAINTLIDRRRSERQEYLKVNSELFKNRRTSQKISQEILNKKSILEYLDGEVIAKQAEINDYTQKISNLSDVDHDMSESISSKQKELQDSNHKLQKSLEHLRTTKEDIEYLQVEKNALTASISELKSLKATIQQQLIILQETAKEKNTYGTRMYGSEWKQLIANARVRQEKESRLSLLERFVALPQIAPLWDRLRPILEKEQSNQKKQHHQPTL